MLRGRSAIHMFLDADRVQGDFQVLLLVHCNTTEDNSEEAALDRPGMISRGISQISVSTTYLQWHRGNVLRAKV